MSLPSFQLIIALEGLLVVTRSLTLEGPNIQQCGLRRRTDVPIGGTISLFIVNQLCRKVYV